jgi:chemotaxis protein histidine kinase CheA
MNLEPAPRLKKSPFIIVAAVCIVTVLLIGLFAPNKFAPLPFLSAVGLLAVSITAIMIPLLVDYAADSAEYVQQERERVTDQVQRLQTAGESLARAAAQIKAVEEAVHKTAHAAENLPYRMQEKLAEFNEALAGKEEDDREALEQELTELRAANSEQLKAVAEKIHKAAADWAALETATRKQLTAAEAALTKIQGAAGDTTAKFETRLASALATLDTKLATFETAGARRSAPPPESPPAPAEEKRTAPESVVESVAVVETGSNPAEPASGGEEPKARKPRAPRKPKEIASATGDGSISGEAVFPDSPGESTSTSASVDESATSAAPAETSASSDGATRLLATAYIGIGNKLFIRGDGPGLSWDRGVPMQFVSIGKWGWATNDAAAAVRCKLYKNDETAAVSGEVVLEPGKHVEVTALF